MKENKVINWFDRATLFSLCALIYFLPISNALVEIWAGFACFFFILKCCFSFYLNLDKGNNKQPLLKYFPSLRRISSWLAIYILMNVISIILSQYAFLSMKGFVSKLLQGASLFLVFIETINSKKRLKCFIGTFLISLSLVTINGIVQYFSGTGFIRGFSVHTGRISSSFRHPNDFGAYLVIILPVLISLFFNFSKGGASQKNQDGEEKSFFIFKTLKSKILLFAISFLTLICLGLTFSRGAWLSFLVSLIILGCKNKKVLITSCVIGGLFMVVFIPIMVQGRFSNVEETTPYLSFTGRGTYWQEAFNIIKEYPFFGIGLNSYSKVAPKYKIFWGGYPHNCYLHMAVEIGLVGLFSFFGFLTSILGRVNRKLSYIKDSFLYSALIGFSSGFIGFLVHSFFDTNFYSVQLGSLMWLIMGVIVAVGEIADRELAG